MQAAQTFGDSLLRRGGGFSLLEVVVVLSVILILIALIGPAVQNARSVAQKTGCVKNLRQFGLAAGQYHETFGTYPVDRPYVSILPFLEQSAMADWIAMGRTVEASPATFVCPTDSLVSRARNHVNYGLNEGNGRYVRIIENGSGRKLFNGMRLTSNFWVQNSTSRDFSDGLSNTAMYSERRVPTATIPTLQSGQADPTPFLWYVDRDYSMPDEYDGFRSACRSGAHATILPCFPRAISFLDRKFGYNHILPPNTPGCHVVAPPWTAAFAHDEGSIPATSRHTGGANVVFVDGHVTFISNSIDMEVWSAVGTRNGGETANLE